MRQLSSLQNLANVAVITVSILAAATYVRTWRHEPPPRPAPTTYAPGDVLPAFGDFSYSRASRSLLLFVSSRCHFCTDSMPFYRELLAQRSRGNPSIAVIALGREREQDLRAYLGSHGVNVDRAISVQGRSDLKLSATPTVLLLNSAGRVQHVWIGALHQDQQRDVLNALSSDSNRP